MCFVYKNLILIIFYEINILFYLIVEYFIFIVNYEVEIKRNSILKYNSILFLLCKYLLFFSKILNLEVR